ncbi:hypothetical protein [Halomonas ramblicola]|uniref:hypothetical protein n=1 Tax=Halomonas ramblicola TaxID=747349 RepID=UPI0025B282C4|nr:hypothetical protein [Halomonas ramblicola]MDN3522048.1 hypothetical protein [Halomonas ramblicola]
MLMVLFWCFAALAAQLALLHYIDLRVARMKRLAPEGAEEAADSTGPERPA